MTSPAPATKGSYATSNAKLLDPIGLHARPGVRLSKVAKGFTAQVEIASNPNGPWVDAKSLIKILSIKAVCGTVLQFRATGADASAAVAALADLVNKGFPE
jgi:phosphocarrier protein